MTSSEAFFVFGERDKSDKSDESDKSDKSDEKDKILADENRKS